MGALRAKAQATQSTKRGKKHNAQSSALCKKEHVALGQMLLSVGWRSPPEGTPPTAAIARVNAARVLSFWEMPPKHALALCKQRTLRFWGLTAQRGWARLILDRFHDLVLLPDNPSATAHDSDSVSYEHHTYFFPDSGRGAANTAGFGWRGGSGV